MWDGAAFGGEEFKLRPGCSAEAGGGPLEEQGVTCPASSQPQLG